MGFVSLARKSVAEVRLSALSKLPGDTIDIVILKQAGIFPGSALTAKVILSGKDRTCRKVRVLPVTKGVKTAMKLLAAALSKFRGQRLAANDSLRGLSGKLGDLKRRLWFFCLRFVVYRIGAHVPVPGIDPVGAERFVRVAAGRHSGDV